jgi:lipopolysaccharide export system permease protein
MKINTIINRYIFFEMVPPFVISLVFLTFIFLMTKILEITNMIVNYRISLITVLLMLIYTMPFFLEFVIPMSIMMSVLLTFLRLSSDNEIISLKSGGLSVYGLVPPVFLFCLAGALLTAFMAIYGLPHGRLAFKELAVNVASSHMDVALKERTFNDEFKDMMLYVNKIDPKNNLLIDVFIEDQRDEKIVSTVIAPKGRMFSQKNNMTIQVRLYNGMINQVDLEKRAVNSINFETYDLSLDLRKAVSKANTGPKDEEEMSLTELKHYIENDTKKDAQFFLTLMEFHKKFSLPFACLALGVLALPLGIQSRSSKRSFGIGLGLVCFLAYYMMLSAGWVFGETGTYPPIIGMWVPNVIMGGLGLFLLVRLAREKTINLAGIPIFFNRVKMSLLRLKAPEAAKELATQEKEPKREKLLYLKKDEPIAKDRVAATDTAFGWGQKRKPAAVKPEEKVARMPKKRIHIRLIGRWKEALFNLDFSFGWLIKLRAWHLNYLSWRNRQANRFQTNFYKKPAISVPRPSISRPSPVHFSPSIIGKSQKRLTKYFKKDKRSRPKTALPLPKKPKLAFEPKRNIPSAPSPPPRVETYTIKSEYLPVLYKTEKKGLAKRFQWKQLGFYLLCIVCMVLLVLAIKYSAEIRNSNLVDHLQFSAVNLKIKELEKSLIKIDRIKKRLLRHENMKHQFVQMIGMVGKFESTLDARMNYLDQELDDAAAAWREMEKTGTFSTDQVNITPNPSQPRYHMLREGETIYSISRRYHLTVDELRRLNGLNPEISVDPGTILIVNPEIE